MSSLMNWNTTAASNNEAAPDGAPENMAPSGVNNTIREMMARVKEMQAGLPWIDYGKGSGTVTYSMTLSNVFEVEGADVTEQYAAGRRIKAVGATTGTIYGTIETSTFTVNTKVYVNWDGNYASLQSETLSFMLGINPVGLAMPFHHGALQGSGFRNWIINGNFDIWQRGNTLTSTVIVGTNAYIADRWGLTASSITVSMGKSVFTVGQTDVPNHPEYAMRVDVHAASVSADYTTFFTRIEGVRTLAGKDVVVSWWGQANAGTTIGLELVQHFGANGYAAGGSNVTIPVGTATLDASWRYHWLTVKVPDLPSGATICSTNYLQLSIFLNQGGDYTARVGSVGADAKTVYFSQVQLEEGKRPTPFEFRPYGVEFSMCQRYYWKLLYGSKIVTQLQAYQTSQAYGGTVNFPVWMYKEPSINSGGVMYLTDKSGANVTVTSLVPAYITNMSFGFSEVSCSTSASLVAGDATILVGGAGALFTANAEL